MTSGIYIMRIGRAFYVGSSRDIVRRMRAHRSLLNRDLHPNDRMQKAFRKHGGFTVEIVAECGADELLVREQELLDVHFGHVDCMNVAPVAGSTVGVKLSAETRARMSRSKTGMVYGPPSAETRRKIAEGNRGKRRTPEQIEAMRVERLTNPQRRAQVAAMSEGNRGRIPTNARLTREMVNEIRGLLGTTTQAAIAKRYGVTPSNINSIARGLTWRENSAPSRAA